jgi:hypothetical protein
MSKMIRVMLLEESSYKCVKEEKDEKSKEQKLYLKMKRYNAVLPEVRKLLHCHSWFSAHRLK